MFARPEIRSKKSTVPVSTFTAYETVPGAGAGVLNPGPRTVGLSGYKNVPGGAIYGEISLGIQDEKMDTENFSPTTHSILSEVTRSPAAKSKALFVETGEIGWWTGAPTNNPDAMIRSFSWQKSKRGAQALTTVFFSGQDGARSNPNPEDCRICYPLVSDCSLQKGETKKSLAFAIANTTQIKVTPKCIKKDGQVPRSPILDGCKVYARLQIVDGVLKTVLHCGNPPEFDAGGYPVVFLGIMKLTWYPGDTHCEVTLSPMKL